MIQFDESFLSIIREEKWTGAATYLQSYHNVVVQMFCMLPVSINL
jgi:hypothetical protein